MSHNGLSQSIITACRQKLITTKAELLNRLRENAMLMQSFDKGSGDEIDQTVAQMEENQFVTHQERIRSQLLEIESALSRIESGSYGICEETDEYIEPNRLLTLPWTRLSIEGAEIREAVGRKFARA